MKIKFSNPAKPMAGFHSDGLNAYSKDEVMGDPCHIIPESLWETWCTFELRNHRDWGKWKTVWFMGIPIKVIVTGADGDWWGCAIDTATVVRILKTDWEILKENYD